MILFIWEHPAYQTAPADAYTTDKRITLYGEIQMATTTFSGPVVSDNGFSGTTLTTTGAVTINGTTVVVSSLPTSDPSNAGQLWNNSGVLTVSAG